MTGRICDVRFTPGSGHGRAQLGCPLCAKSGHLPSMAGTIASWACASIRSLTTADGGFQPMTADRTVFHLEGTDFQKSRAFSPAVVTQGGKIVWLAGQTALTDPDGKSIAHDFEAQARACFTLIDRTLNRVGGTLADLVTMTVSINDPRYGDRFIKVRHEMFPHGKFPCSALITVSCPSGNSDRNPGRRGGVSALVYVTRVDCTKSS